MKTDNKYPDKVIAVAENGLPVTEGMFQEWCDSYDKGCLPDGYEVEGPVMGRPRLFDEEMVSLAVRLTKSQKQRLEQRAKEKGLTTSAYVRDLLARAS